MKTLAELSDQIDVLTQAVSNQQAKLQLLTDSLQVATTQMAQATGDNLRHSNDIQQLRVVAGIDVANVSVPTP